jgi:hypothetical protein
MSSEGAPHERAADESAAPSEEQLRAAYEEELARITSTDVMLQAAVSLINLGGRRLGPAPGAAPEETPPVAARDMEQVRDAIDGVRALLGVLERRLSAELGPLRDALSQLQIAYAREAPAAAAATGASSGSDPAQSPPAPKPGEEGDDSAGSRGPGPAESSGRLWVPGS